MASTIKSGSNNDLYIQTDGVDRIVVDSNGNTSVVGELEVNSSSSATWSNIINTAGSGNRYSGIKMQDGATINSHIYTNHQDGNFAIRNDFAGGVTRFYTTPSGGALQESMSVNGNGYVTMPYQPHAQVYKSNGGNDTVAAGTTVVWNVVNSNIGNIYNVANGRFTVPVAGRYMVATVVMTGSINKYGIYNVRRNGNTTFPSGWAQGYNYGTANDKQIVFVGVVDLDANDYLDVYVNGSSSNNSLYWGGYNYMTVTLVG